jgi:hypothetical protein
MYAPFFFVATHCTFLVVLFLTKAHSKYAIVYSVFFCHMASLSLLAPLLHPLFHSAKAGACCHTIDVVLSLAMRLMPANQAVQ